MTLPPCPGCDEVRWRASYSFDGGRLFICATCGLGALQGELPDPEELYRCSYYASGDPGCGYADYASLEVAQQRTSGARLQRIERLLPARGRLLDVGCGLGTALEVAVRRGWQAAGLEVASNTVAAVRARGLDVSQQRAEQLDAEDRYDCITMWDTIEHLDEPRAACRAAARALRPGGVLALTTGDRSAICARLCGRAWHLYNIPEHRFFFTPDSLRRLLTKAGLVVVSIRRRGAWYPLSYLAERLQRTLGLPAAAPARRAAVCLYVNLFDILEVHARVAASPRRASCCRQPARDPC